MPIDNALINLRASHTLSAITLINAFKNARFIQRFEMTIKLSQSFNEWRTLTQQQVEMYGIKNHIR